MHRRGWRRGGWAWALALLLLAACNEIKAGPPKGTTPGTAEQTPPPAEGEDSGLDASVPPPPEDPLAASRIARENQLPGTRDWRINAPALKGEIEGYPFEPSSPAGTTIPIAVSVKDGRDFSWQVFRSGDYQGTGGRLMAAGGPLKGEKQADPSFDPATTLVEARWHETFRIPTAEADGTPWPTGVYLVKLVRDDGLQQYTVFVLRDDTRDAAVAVQLPTATWQAYNNWGGESLYLSARGLPGKKARRVSFDRPYIDGYGHGSGLFAFVDRPLVQWLESKGYDVEYLTNTETGAPDGHIGNHRLLIAVGHDEYHSPEAMDRFEEALGRGVSLAFLTGNTAYWAVRYEDSPRGRNKTVACFKELPAQDPLFGVDDRRATGHFRKAPQNRPENRLLGVISNGDSVSTAVDWVVKDAGHWLYAGTGLKAGDRIPGVVGFEWDSFVDNGQNPAGLTILSHSPVDAQSGRSFHNAVVYERDKAFLFAASTVWYARALLTEPRAGQILENALQRAGATRQTLAP